MKSSLSYAAAGSIAVLLFAAAPAFAQQAPGGFGRAERPQPRPAFAQGSSTQQRPATGRFAARPLNGTTTPERGFGRIAAAGFRGGQGPMGSSTASTTRRAEIQARVEQRRAEVEQRIAQIRDQHQQKMVEQIAQRFTDLNATWTKHFSSLLDRYAAILQKIQDRASAAAAAGKDASAATAAIQAAQASIATARTAVATQAANSYVISLPSASTTPATVGTSTPNQAQTMQAFRDSFQTLHKQLFADLIALRDGPMKDVRTAVEAAFKALSQIPGVDQVTVPQTATSTASATTTNQ